MIFYFIITTSRTGSSLLVEYLQSLKKYGIPRERIREYKEQGVPLFEAVDKIFDETNTNNVAGDKTLIRLFFDYLNNPSKRNYTYKYIFWTRKDVLAQAISIYRAKESNLWHTRIGDNKKNPRIPFDELKILKHKNIIDKENFFAEEMFKKFNINPLRLSYEDLLENKQKTLKSISEYLNIDFDENKISDSTLCVTRDDLTEEWLKNMREKI